MPVYPSDHAIEEKVQIIQSGKWWVVELDEPSIAAQGESEEEALDKIKKRFEQYKKRGGPNNEWTDHSNNRLLSHQR